MKKAFTLIELLIVIAIIGILAGVLFVSIGQRPLVQARDAKRTADLQNFRTALTLYYTDNASYPFAVADLIPIYIPAAPRDPKHDATICGLATYPSNTKGVPANTSTLGDYGYRYDATTAAGGACTTAGKDCTNYVVQACLEDTNNSALQTDCDSGGTPVCLGDPVFDIHS